jgi:hypothetical protein
VTGIALGAGAVAGLATGVSYTLIAGARTSDFNHAGCVDNVSPGTTGIRCQNVHEDYVSAVVGYSGALLLGGASALLLISERSGEITASEHYWTVRRKVALGLGAGAVGALATGINFHLASSFRTDQINETGCSASPANAATTACGILHDEYTSARNAAIFGYATAVALGGVSAVLFMTSSSGPDRQPAAVATLRCAPQISDDRFGAMCGGWF